VLDHTWQGFHGGPRQGGNRNYVSYRMMGLAYPILLARNRDGHDRPTRST
jgi:gluconate 2-dehydrogenase gamma chain